ncbi:hypothetical protein Ancab_028502 [Ancistrocladus abbreviatus]
MPCPSVIRSLPANFNASTDKRGWIMRSLSGEREKPARERKGWMVMIYDLSGSPVGVASVITPFVLVSLSNPGTWLILRRQGVSVSRWTPWGRLEAWRERGPVDCLGYKFELVRDTGPTTNIPMAESTMSVRNGGQFCIDGGRITSNRPSSRSPLRGFVMGSTVEAEGKVSKPMVQVGAQHVTCMADAAIFV